jgi:hypothetical protein
MRKFIIPAFAALLTSASSHAAPADDLAVAAQRLADAPNYSWTSKEKTLRRSISVTTSVQGVTERDGFTVTKKTTSATSGPDYVENTVYWGTQIAYLRNGSWKTAEELQAAAGGRSGVTVVGTGVANSGRGVGAMTVTPQNDSQPSTGRPAQMVLWILAQVNSVTASGDALVADLSHDYIARVMRGNGRNGPLAVSPRSTGSAKFWIKDGAIAGYQTHIKASYEDSDVPLAERTTTVEIKNVGSTVVAVPAEAKAKFKL